MSEEVEVSLRIGDRRYTGKLHPEQIEASKAPIFPEPYAEMLTITDQGSFWHVKPKRFLGTENFTEIARIVKQFGGEYVSAGKSSHFKIWKT